VLDRILSLGDSVVGSHTGFGTTVLALLANKRKGKEGGI
jgi:hypothetical protein